MCAITPRKHPCIGFFLVLLKFWWKFLSLTYQSHRLRVQQVLHDVPLYHQEQCQPQSKLHPHIWMYTIHPKPHMYDWPHQKPEEQYYLCFIWAIFLFLFAKPRITFNEISLNDLIWCNYYTLHSISDLLTKHVMFFILYLLISALISKKSFQGFKNETDHLLTHNWNNKASFHFATRLSENFQPHLLIRAFFMVANATSEEIVALHSEFIS